MRTAANRGCLSSFLCSLDPFEVVDAACGGGEFTELLVAKLAGFHRLIGFDPDKESLDEARVLIDDRRVHFTLASIEEVMLPDHHFDLVTISNALHHLGRPNVALGRLYELVRPGGFLLIHEMVADELSAAERNYRDLHHLKAAVDRYRGATHNPTYSREALRRLALEAAGNPSARAETTAEAGRPAIPRLDLDCVVLSKPEDQASVRARIAFIEEYVAEVTDRAARDEFEAAVTELRTRVLVEGLQTPRRAAIALGRPPEQSE